MKREDGAIHISMIKLKIFMALECS